MLNMKSPTNTITGKFSKQAENALSDERFRPVEFAFDVSTWGQNAQLRLFHVFAAYITVMDEYNQKHFVPRQLQEIANLCTQLKAVLDENVKVSKQSSWTQPPFEGMEYTAN